MLLCLSGLLQFPRQLTVTTSCQTRSLLNSQQHLTHWATSSWKYLYFSFPHTLISCILSLHYYLFFCLLCPLFLLCRMKCEHMLNSTPTFLQYLCFLSNFPHLGLCHEYILQAKSFKVNMFSDVLFPETRVINTNDETSNWCLKFNVCNIDFCMPGSHSR